MRSKTPRGNSWTDTSRKPASLAPSVNDSSVKPYSGTRLRAEERIFSWVAENGGGSGWCTEKYVRLSGLVEALPMLVATDVAREDLRIMMAEDRRADENVWLRRWVRKRDQFTLRSFPGVGPKKIKCLGIRASYRVVDGERMLSALAMCKWGRY